MLFKDKIYQYVPAIVPDNITVFRDVDYASGTRHQLDIYRPKTQHTVGVIVDIYGGGLLRGEKSSHQSTPHQSYLTHTFQHEQLKMTVPREFQQFDSENDSCERY